jgi:hypothetical protein
MEIVSIIFWGLLLIGGGGAILKWSGEIVDFFGHIEQVDRKIGPGGSRVLVILVAFIMIILGITTLFGYTDDVLKFMFSPFRTLNY